MQGLLPGVREAAAKARSGIPASGSAAVFRMGMGEGAVMGTFELTNALIRGYLARNGWKSTPEVLEILGLRGCVPADAAGRRVRLVENEPDAYNDTLLVYGPELKLFRGSVDPGSTWTLRPANPLGCAHLLNGQWRYQRGTHRGRPALVQAAPVRVWRDGDRDHALDPHERVESGWFGIHIHAGGTGPSVREWSAGCQIIQGGWDGAPWREFYATVESFRQQRTFQYTLCDGVGLARWMKGEK